MVISARTGNSSKAGLLGYLTFMSIGQLRVHKNDLAASFQNAGLSLHQYQPGDIRASDAFRRATSLLRNKKIPIQYGGGQAIAILDITEFSTDDEVLRYVGRKVVDDKNRKLDYQKITVFVFDRSTEDVTYDPIATVFLNEANYDSIMNDIVNTYKDWCTYHTKDTIRNICNKVIASLMPTPVTAVQGEPSIAKFIPVTYEKELMGLKQVISDLSSYHLNGEESAVQYIELFESDANKALLNAAVHGDVQAKIQTMINEMTETLKKKGSITVEAGTRMANKLQEMRKEVVHYSNLLGTSMTILEKQIATALTRVEQAPKDEENN